MKLYYNCLILTVLLFLMHFNVPAQSFEGSLVSGMVTDATDAPVPGVRVDVQEKDDYTFTDETGRFSLRASQGDVLVFTKKEILTSFYDVLRHDQNIRIVVRASIAEGGEEDDVFIPFDTRKRRAVNSSIAALKGSDLPQIPSSSLTNLLSGRLPGLNVWQTGSAPGRDETTIVIRNRASFAGSNVPLFLVDGVARDFSDMDVNEIEAITVLKDAASLAWYGNRAANGVLLITTKRGSAEQTRFTYDAQIGSQIPTALAKPLNSYAFATLYNQALQNDGFEPLYTSEALNAYRTNSDPYGYPDNNFVESFIKNNALVQRHVLTASGGSKAIRYFTSLSYFDQNGLYKNAYTPLFNTNIGYQRFNLRTNLDVQVTPQLSVQLDMGGRVEDRREPGSTNNSFLGTVFGLPPNAFPMLNKDGSYGGSNLFRDNPLAQLKSQGYISDVTRVLLGTVNATHKLDFLTKGLSANLFYTFDINGRYTSGRSQTYEVYEQGLDGELFRYGNQTPLGYRTSAFSSPTRINELWTGIDYDRIVKGHHFRGTLRYQQATSFDPVRLADKRQGFSGRMSYSFIDRYYVDLVTSYTGVDNYMPGKQFGFFPAVAVGWVVSDEKSLRNAGFLNYLKISGSYGKSGNNSTGEAGKFAYAHLYNVTNGSYPFGTSFGAQQGASERALPNPDLTWEKAYKTDVGLDAKLFGNALQLSANYFNERRNDILTNPIYPSIIGLASYRVNDGETRLRGFEGFVNLTHAFGEVVLSLGGNYTYAKSKIIRINESSGLAPYQLQKGHNIAGVTGMGKLMLQSDGIFQSQAEIDNSPVQRFAGKVQPGDIRYLDNNDDGVIDNYDRVMTDYNDTPTTYYGFNLSGQYRAFDFSLLMQGVSGRTIQIRTLVFAGSNNTGYINQFSPEAWSTDNPDGVYPRLGISDRANNTADSDFWLRSGNYLRLKSVELGYTLPHQLTDKINSRGLRVYINGFNLLNFNKTGIDIDPEMPFAGYNSYPYVKTITAGINLRF